MCPAFAARTPLRRLRPRPRPPPPPARPPSRVAIQMKILVGAGAHSTGRPPSPGPHCPNLKCQTAGPRLSALSVVVPCRGMMPQAPAFSCSQLSALSPNSLVTSDFINAANSKLWQQIHHAEALGAYLSFHPSLFLSSITHSLPPSSSPPSLHPSSSPPSLPPSSSPSSLSACMQECNVAQHN
jgi:hypothetical protein